MAAPRPDSTGLSPVSRDWLDRTDPALRKRRGQYLTPRPVAERLLDRLELRPGMRVLDPGVGTGELLRAALDREPGIEAFGWDTDPDALEAASRLAPEATLELRSALDDPGSGDAAGGGFDLVVGNPPYFQVRLTATERSRFAGVISGRANVFALFFRAGLDLLGPEGRLGYIVPPSMNSGAYFEALREHIVARATIEDLTVLDGTDRFEGANTAVQLLILAKRAGGGAAGGGDGPFVFRREVPEDRFRRVVFTADPDRLTADFEGRPTLWEAGLTTVTGSVVWNQHRDRLRERPGPDAVPLVWSRNLRSGRLRLDGAGGGAGKAQYLAVGTDRSPRPLAGPAILVNRVVGAVGRGELRTALVPEGFEFLAENHVNVIRARAGTSPDRVPWEWIERSLSDPATAGRVRRLTGNTQISAREMTHLLPLDIGPGRSGRDRVSSARA